MLKSRRRCVYEQEKEGIEGAEQVKRRRIGGIYIVLGACICCYRLRTCDKAPMARDTPKRTV